MTVHPPNDSHSNMRTCTVCVGVSLRCHSQIHYIQYYKTLHYHSNFKVE